MKKLLPLLAALVLITGCATHKTSQKIDHYEASVAQCTENGNELDCYWDNATDDWKNASQANFETSNQTR